MSVYRGRLILLAIGAIIALAIIGVYQLDAAGFAAQPTDYLYRIVQLFTAEGDWTAGHTDLPWALEAARFLAPIVTVATLVILFAEGIWTTLVNARARLYRNHIIVVGLSAAAMTLIRSCHRRNINVVVIERDPNNNYIPTCRRLRIPVLIGDGKQAELLKRARIHLARCLLSFIDEDDDNVELSLRIQEVVKDIRSVSAPPLKVVLQIRDLQLGARLEAYPKFFEYPQSMEVRFFNLDEQAARSLFRDFYPEVYADALGLSGVHIVVIGYSGVGLHVVNAALKQAHYGNESLLKITVLDPHAGAVQQAFDRQCPAIGLAAEIHFVEVELSAEVIRQKIQSLSLSDASMFVTSLGSDSDNMSMALAVRQIALLALVPNAPIFVSLRHSRGLAQLVESGRGNPEIPDGLYPFGMLEQLMRVDRMINEHQDQVAVALHETYLAGLGDKDASQASHQPWGRLPEAFRNPTRAQADHVNIKLRASGYGLTQSGDSFSFSDAEAERLARIEKMRWIGERASQGWSYAAQRSDLAKVHPALIPWNKSTTAEHAADLASVRALPSILNSHLQLGITRQIIIGITGHRAHRLVKYRDHVETEVRKQLKQISALYPGANFAVLSALADGSDRLFADLAVETLDADLIVALPLPYEIYKRSFGHESFMTNKASNEEFQRFVGRASLYFEMPLRFGGAQALEQDNKAGESARSHQYALAGAYIASRAHELIAIWDGQDALGTGGTGDVVRWRDTGEIPAEYQFEGHFFAPVEMSETRVISIPFEPAESIDKDDSSNTAEQSAG